MNSEDLKLFAIFYIKEDEVLTDKEKIQLMDFVESSNDEGVLFLLASGQMPGERVFTIKEDGDAFRVEESVTIGVVQKGIELGIAGLDAAELTRAGFHAGKAGFQTAKTVKTFKREIPKQEKPWGQSSTFLGGVAAASLAASIVHKMGAKNLKKLRLQCDREKGKAKTVCYNKVRRDAIRTEIVSLSSMKIKCRKTKDSEKCIKKIEQRIKELQNRMDSIKVF